MNNYSFVEAINKAFYDTMNDDEKVICMGLGVPDPKGVFGTTIGLQDAFGSERVFDIPTSENSITGICIGLAIAGYRPVLTHQRLDFALLSLDQIINNAAKVHYMFGGKLTCPIVIRMIMGRGWGQGPTHSQNLQQMFAGIPGLRVVIPSNPQDAYSLLRASIACNDPVIFLEHRWLHNAKENIKLEFNINDLRKQQIIEDGDSYTIVACSYMIPEAIRASKCLKNYYSIYGTLINFRNYSSKYIDEVIESCSKTNNLLIADTAQNSFSIAHKLAIDVMEKCENIKNIKILTMPDTPEPTSYFLTKNFYNGAKEIIEGLEEILGEDFSVAKNELTIPTHHDIPGDWFKGPF